MCALFWPCTLVFGLWLELFWIFSCFRVGTRPLTTYFAYVVLANIVFILKQKVVIVGGGIHYTLFYGILICTRVWIFNNRRSFDNYSKWILNLFYCNLAIFSQLLQGLISSQNFTWLTTNINLPPLWSI